MQKSKVAGSHVRRLLATALLLGCFASPAHADGGTVRLSEQSGPYQITLFTSPEPLRAGPVDVSVLVQSAETKAPLADVQVMILVAREEKNGTLRRVVAPASTSAATNKLYQAAQLELAQPGEWRITARISGKLGEAEVSTKAEVMPPAPRWQAYWPWFAWPAVVIVLFVLKQSLKQKSRRPHEPLARGKNARRI